MYIPSSFFGSQNACIVATATTLAGSGSITTGNFVSQSISWSYIQFENTANLGSNLSSFTASFNVLSGSTSQAKLLIVAGGGGGGDASINLCPSSPADTAAGGGGGGGVVYYNNFPISPGTYEICVGAGGGNKSTHNNGKNSHIKLPNNTTYTPFNSSYIIAYGGGAGGYVTQACGTSVSLTNQNPQSGGSGGGASRPYTFAEQAGASSNYNGLGGLNGANQGNSGGSCLNGIDGIQYNVQGAGGGGSAVSASNATFPTSNTLVTNGGDGLSFNVTGTSLTYAGGGGGAVLTGFPNTFYSGSNGSCTSGFGAGGRGGASYTGDPSTIATSGVVTIVWPICLYTASVPPPEPIVLPSIITGSLAIWNYWSTYTASATSWYDSSGNGNNATIYDVTDDIVETLDSLTIISQSVQFNRNKLAYSPYPINATPSSSYSIQFYGQLNSTSSKYALLDNGYSPNMNIVRAGVEDAGSNNYLVFAQGSNSFNQFFLPFTGSAIFSGSNLITVNVNAAAGVKTAELFLNTQSIASGSSTSSLNLPRDFNDGAGPNQFGASNLEKAGPGGALIPPVALFANVKSVAIYGKELTQSEIIQNYNALTSSI
jgi:hypothetical protein